MRSNSSTRHTRVDTYQRDPDPSPQDLSSETATTLAEAWQSAHVAAIEHDKRLGIVCAKLHKINKKDFATKTQSVE